MSNPMLELAERVERIALNFSARIFPNEIEWSAEDLAVAADAFTVADALRSRASMGDR